MTCGPGLEPIRQLSLASLVSQLAQRLLLAPLSESQDCAPSCLPKSYCECLSSCSPTSALEESYKLSCPSHSYFLASVMVWCWTYSSSHSQNVEPPKYSRCAFWSSRRSWRRQNRAMRSSSWFYFWYSALEIELETTPS